MSTDTLVKEIDKEAQKNLSTYAFKIFLVIADQDFNISVKEAEEFQRRISKHNWARSDYLRLALAEIEKQYRNLWKQYHRGKLQLEASSLVDEYQSIIEQLDENDIDILKKDLINLSRGIARSNAGLFGKSNKEALAKLVEAFLLEPKAEKAQLFLPQRIEDKDEAMGTEEIYTYGNEVNEGEATTVEEPKAETTGKPQEPKPKVAVEKEPKAQKARANESNEAIKTENIKEPAKPEKAETTKSETKVPAKARSAREFMPMAFVDLDGATVWHKGKINLEIVAIKEETHDVKTFRFIANPPAFFNYKPGQFITLELMINDKRVLRSYTISSSPVRSQFLEITVKRVEGGLVSNWLCDNAYVGMTLSAKGPNGKFSCTIHPSEKLLFLSGGSGITPMMSMSRWLAQTGATCDVVFFHNAHSKRDIIFRHEIKYLEKALPGFKAHISLTRNPPEIPWDGLTGRIDLNMIEEIAPDYRERRIFVCGPAGFMNKVKEVLTVCGFDVQNQYHQESFGAAKKAKKPVEAKPTEEEVITTMVEAPEKPKNKAPASKEKVFTFTSVHFAESQIEVFGGDMDVPLLELAEEIGIDIPNSCRSGSCGSCKAIKMFGKVTEDSNEGLSEAEIEEGYILTCVSYASGYVELDT